MARRCRDTTYGARAVVLITRSVTFFMILKTQLQRDGVRVFFLPVTLDPRKFVFFLIMTGQFQFSKDKTLRVIRQQRRRMLGWDLPCARCCPHHKNQQRFLIFVSRSQHDALASFSGPRDVDAYTYFEDCCNFTYIFVVFLHFIYFYYHLILCIAI